MKYNMESRVVGNCIAGFSFTKMYVCLLSWPAYWRDFYVRRMENLHDSVAKGNEVIGNILHAK